MDDDVEDVDDAVEDVDDDVEHGIASVEDDDDDVEQMMPASRMTSQARQLRPNSKQIGSLQTAKRPRGDDEDDEGVEDRGTERCVEDHKEVLCRCLQQETNDQHWLACCCVGIHRYGFVECGAQTSERDEHDRAQRWEGHGHNRVYRWKALSDKCAGLGSLMAVSERCGRFRVRWMHEHSRERGALSPQEPSEALCVG